MSFSKGVSSATAQDVIDTYWDAYLYEDYERAVRIITPLALSGNSEAVYLLAGLVLEGEGVAENDVLGTILVHKAAQMGNPRAKGMLGHFFMNGIGVKPNKAKGVRLLVEAYGAGAPGIAKSLTTYVQELLNARGYDAGSPDGIMGANTKRAILAFRRDHGLGESEEIDELLMLSLTGAMSAEQQELLESGDQSSSGSDVSIEGAFTAVEEILLSHPAFKGAPEFAVRSFKLRGINSGDTLHGEVIDRVGRIYSVQEDYRAEPTEDWPVYSDLTTNRYAGYPFIHTASQMRSVSQAADQDEPSTEFYRDELVAIDDIRGKLFPLAVGNRTEFTLHYKILGPNGADYTLRRTIEVVGISEPEEAEDIFLSRFATLKHTEIYTPAGGEPNSAEWESIFAESLGFSVDEWYEASDHATFEDDVLDRNMIALGYVRVESVQEPVEEPDVGPSTEEKTIKQRLAELRELVEEGLITEDEAAEKRAEILEGL
ncbi:MAG: peptidoglycan-binding protein [Rhodospirillales bacterium]